MGKLFCVKEMAEAGYSHAEKLHVFIEECIKESNITVKDLSAIAVSQGPGSYTGLRIGVSAVKRTLFCIGFTVNCGRYIAGFSVEIINY
jgi:tRNA threonylcarbamoyladenosine biosynthesis protein TsaB